MQEFRRFQFIFLQAEYGIRYVAVTGVQTCALPISWKSPVISGFQLAPIFSYNSGHPFNLLAGGEVNGNNHTTNQRPIGAGRDTGLGPSYTAFDMRLSWHHKIQEKATLLLTAEGFNIANHTNFASVNNEVGPLFGFAPGFTTFNVHGRDRKSTRLNSSHGYISYAVFCLKKKNIH